MVVDLAGRATGLRAAKVQAVILLDTNAVIWTHLGHPRAKALARLGGQHYVSPATILELQLLAELGRLTLVENVSVSDLVEQGDWLVDEVPSVAWFEEASALTWTRDPFDRLIAAHAALRGWRLATGDARLIDRLGARRSVAL
jgi:PIN domain nuclease of toxin-antitoxin system